MQTSENLAIVYLPLANLTPHPQNPRQHPATQRAQIAESIRTFGWTSPVLIDEDGVILAGHGRCEVAKDMDMDTVPTVTIKGLTEEQKRAYVLADNKLAENAHWDASAVLAELEFITAAGIDVEILGFTNDDMLGLESMVDDTDFPEHVPPAEPGEKITTETEPTMLQGDGTPSLSDAKLDVEDAEDHTDVPGGNVQSEAPFGEGEVIRMGEVFLPIPLTDFQRDRIIEVLDMVKREEEVESDTDALVMLAELFAEQVGE